MLTCDYAAKIVGMVLIILVARMVGAAEFGKYAYALNLAILLSVIADFGMGYIITREVAANPEKANKVLRGGLWWRWRLGILAFILCVLAVVIMGKGVEILILVILISGSTIIVTVFGSIEAYLKGQERFGLLAVLSIARQSALLLGGILVLLSGYGIRGVASIQLTMAVLGGIVLLAVVRNRGLGSDQSPQIIRKKIIQDALPMAMTALCVMFYYRIDVLILSSVKGDAAVGYYNAARSLLLGLVILPAGVMTAFLPMASKLLQINLAKLREVALQLFQHMAFIGGAIAVGGWLLSFQVISLIFGQKYGLAAPPLKILLWAFFFMCLNSLQGTILIALELQHLQTYAVGFAALLNLILNLLMIPPWGANGAALAAVATEALVFVLAGIFIRKYFSGAAMFRALWKVGVGFVVAVPAIFVFQNLGFPGGAGIPLVVFILTVWALGGLSWQKVWHVIFRNERATATAR